MSGKKGMKGSGGARPGAGRPPGRHIVRLGAWYTLRAGAAVTRWTVTTADSEGITLTNAAGDSITITASA